jgi:Cu+-exporting ATPase
VVLDKTGTITMGKPQVLGITLAENYSLEEVLALLRALELNSEHPLAAAVVEYCAASAVPLQVSKFESLSGCGVRGVIDSIEYSAGSAAWMMQIAQLNLDLIVESPYSQIYLAKASEVLARVEISDALKPDSAAAIAELQQAGLRVIMLTGDNPASAHAVAGQVSITEVYANCQPADKINLIKRLQNEGNKVVFVGDGINDAPSLVQANLGIAIGGGTDIAMQSAAITLMCNSLSGVSRALDLARKINRNMRQNLFGSFVYNSLAVLVAAGVFYPWCHMALNPVIASVVMSLSSLTVITNALRLRYA